MNAATKFLCMLAMLLGGCALKVPDVTTYVDRAGRRTDLIPANLLEAGGQTRELVWLNASRVFRASRAFDFFLEVRYQAAAETGWLDIRPGVSLVIVADGKELKFSSSGSLNRRREKNNLVSEDAIFPASAGALRQVALAKVAQVKITGQNGMVVRDFAPENFARFRAFVAQFVDAPPAKRTK